MILLQMGDQRSPTTTIELSDLLNPAREEFATLNTVTLERD